MSSHYSDRVMQKPLPKYEILSQTGVNTSCEGNNFPQGSCPGSCPNSNSCSCNMGQRSNFDRMMMQKFNLNKIEHYGSMPTIQVCQQNQDCRIPSQYCINAGTPGQPSVEPCNNNQGGPVCVPGGLYGLPSHGVCNNKYG